MNVERRPASDQYVKDQRDDLIGCFSLAIFTIEDVVLSNGRLVYNTKNIETEGLE